MVRVLGLSPLFLLATAGCSSEQNLARGDDDPSTVGTLPERWVDRFVQTEVAASDILFVVDDSCSMEQEQALMADNFPAMFAWLAGSEVDWHVGVVTTDMTDPARQGRLVAAADGAKWLEPSTPEGAARFAEMVTVGTGGGDERGRAAAYAALTTLADDDNAGFVRDDAGLHVIIVSDENDGSESPVRNQWIHFLDTARPDPAQVTASSITGPLVGCPDTAPGTEYQAVTEAVGGVWWPICQEPWADVFALLGRNVLGLTPEYFLTNVPVRAQFDVQVFDGDEVIPLAPDVDYAYDPARNSVVLLDTLPPPGAVVEIAYLVAGD